MRLSQFSSSVSTVSEFCVDREGGQSQYLPIKNPTSGFITHHMRHHILHAPLDKISRQQRKGARRPHRHVVLARPAQTLVVQLVQAVLQRHREHAHNAVNAAGARLVEVVTVVRAQRMRRHLLQALQRQHVGQRGQLEQTDALRRMRRPRVDVAQRKVHAAKRVAGQLDALLLLLVVDALAIARQHGGKVLAARPQDALVRPNRTAGHVQRHIGGDLLQEHLQQVLAETARLPAGQAPLVRRVDARPAEAGCHTGDGGQVGQQIVVGVVNGVAAAIAMAVERRRAVGNGVAGRRTTFGGRTERQLLAEVRKQATEAAQRVLGRG